MIHVYSKWTWSQCLKLQVTENRSRTWMLIVDNFHIMVWQQLWLGVIAVFLPFFLPFSALCFHLYILSKLCKQMQRTNFLNGTTYQGHIKSKEVTNRFIGNKHHPYIRQVYCSFCLHMTARSSVWRQRKEIVRKHWISDCP